MTRCVLLKNSTVKSHSWISSSIIGWKSVVGQWVSIYVQGNNYGIITALGVIFNIGRIMKRSRHMTFPSQAPRVWGRVELEWGEFRGG